MWWLVWSKYLFTGLDSASELNTALLSSQLLPVSICRVEDNATFFVQATAEDMEVTTYSVIESFLNNSQVLIFQDSVTE